MLGKESEFDHEIICVLNGENDLCDLCCNV